MMNEVEIMLASKQYSNKSYCIESNIKHFLKKNNFDKISNLDEIVSDGYVAITKGTHNYDVLLYNTKDIIFNDFGIQMFNDKKYGLYFLDMREYKGNGDTKMVCSHKDERLSLFIPDYLVKLGGVYFLEEQPKYFSGCSESLIVPYHNPKIYKSIRDIKNEDFDIYEEIKQNLKKVRLNLFDLKKYIEDDLTKKNISFDDVVYRAKKITSVYSWFKRKPYRGYHDLIDVNAIRIITNEPYDCYAVLEEIYKLFDKNLDCIKDLIPIPKPNLFQFQKIVTSYKNKPIEVQIQTKDMINIAVNGTANNYRIKNDCV
jgi:hypothetical protein